MKVNEIFYSLQGEGITAGYPTVFIRLTGCNLRCLYCDTVYAYEEGQEMSVKDVADRVHEYGAHYVCITGGEPLQQKAELKLLLSLLNRYTVTIETNGSLSLEDLSFNYCHFAMDIKTPGSGMHLYNDFSNIEFLRSKDEIKFIIGSRTDYDFARGIIEKYKLAQKVIVTFSPVFGLEPRFLAQWVLEDKLFFVRVQLQIHKYIWEPGARGV
ncbi:Radical SAM domain protein [Desulfofarcimen acetoxidans DSM 771]|uniref:7-carboxy-7-deazaguanine synthase n=1 Tax=Desulfofarcimen acetoxidans (strain ATCC 49208 / DSM 771 / KCTC 5769 / VKM B-1644 / 5575) TaxID=485916 RepID=C8VWI0_DESAS|nr:radical SAM protein [Desulfofarcimen acetoxidans]ACV64344.1 Radical SAM domain protein [Desulfofarcimen acetoxidans DSM 771]